MSAVPFFDCLSFFIEISIHHPVVLFMYFHSVFYGGDGLLVPAAILWDLWMFRSFLFWADFGSLCGLAHLLIFNSIVKTWASARSSFVASRCTDVRSPWEAASRGSLARRGCRLVPGHRLLTRWLKRRIRAEEGVDQCQHVHRGRTGMIRFMTIDVFSPGFEVISSRMLERDILEQAIPLWSRAPRTWHQYRPLSNLSSLSPMCLFA